MNKTDIKLVRTLFGDYWSMTPERFLKRCKELNISQQKQIELYNNGCFREIALEHLEIKV